MLCDGVVHSDHSTWLSPGGPRRRPRGVGYLGDLAERLAVAGGMLRPRTAVIQLLELTTLGTSSPRLVG